jgi:hypothetical protein
MQRSMAGCENLSEICSVMKTSALKNDIPLSFIYPWKNDQSYMKWRKGFPPCNNKGLKLSHRFHAFRFI